MGYRHSADEILREAAAVGFEHGLTGITFARVAERLGISDRMVVYYFPTKNDLITAVVGHLGRELQVLLEGAFGSEPLDPHELMRRAWPVLSSSAADPIFRLFLELIGMAGTRREPYGQLAPMLLEQWVSWLESRVAGHTAAQRRRAATAVIAQVDGLLMVRSLLGPAAARGAAAELGLLDEPG
jgi:hypothetical protein